MTKFHPFCYVAVLAIGWSMAFAAPVASSKEVIEIDKALRDVLERNLSIRGRLMYKIGLSAYDPKGLRLNKLALGQDSKLDVTKAHMDVPSSSYKYITSTTYDNCGGIAASRNIAITHAVENSVEWSVENSFGVGVSASADVDTPFGGASFGIEASYDFTSGQGGSQTTSKEVSDEQQVEFPDEKGVFLFALYARSLDSSNAWVPFWMDFKPRDDTTIEVHFINTKTNYADEVKWGTKTGVTVYTDGNYKGLAIHYILGWEGRWEGTRLDRTVSSMKVDEGAGAYLYMDGTGKPFFGGPHNAKFLGPLNDKAIGLRVIRFQDLGTKTIRWDELTELLPANLQSFRIHGRMKFKQVDVNDVKMVSYRLGAAAVKEECGEFELPPGVAGGRRFGKSGGRSAPGIHRPSGAAPRHTGDGQKVSAAHFHKMAAAGDLRRVDL